MFTRRRRITVVRALYFCVALLVLTSAIGLAQGPVKSAILMIGDGMGPLQVRMASEYLGTPLLMETLPVKAAISTESAGGAVTDSAAAATALATGHKTNNGMIGVTPDGQPKKTILEAAREQGKATGTITTTNPGHATPGGFVAHVRSRSLDQEIVAQGMAVQDLIMGAGRKLFLPTSQGGSRSDGRNLVEEAKQQGYQYVTTSKELTQVQPGKVLGLFSTSSSMTSVLSRARGSGSTEPTLAEMTKKALEVLTPAEKGFFLMVEGGKIDSGGHGNDTMYCVSETVDFDEAVAVAWEYVRQHPDTLLVVTADHETGGLSVTGEANGQVLRGLKSSTSTMASAIMTNRSATESILREQAGIESPSAMEISVLSTVKDRAAVETALNNIIARRAGFGWTTTGHTGVDVPLFAGGAQADVFRGDVYPNTDVPKRLAKVMGLQLD